ncbi:hypothetical protein ACWT_6245 [Actinoplanes sp. SE50]|nr:hypothetical protein ACPL_6378 [Actinoplanes sp. SE50/110]ATO85660.1 hypothetical protein ACWT_6245 [Actinoplanes sp. SE50]SLM03073.1 uncharacterized protein ACSP50_6362 [Actinoplanes sp. SE50/110]
MTGFGGKQAWLAVRDSEPEAVLAALGLRDLGPIRWRDGLDLAHLTGDRVAATPPLPGARDSRWTLVAGHHLMTSAPDVVAISATLGTEVQYFATHRVTESHRWQRAGKGDLLRAFGYVGQTGEVTSWFGEPGPAEREAGLPGEFVPEETTVLVAERDVFRVAGAWSIDPTTLTGPAPGPLRIGAAA